MLVPILLGAKIDEPHGRAIAEILDRFGVRSEIFVVSGQKVPELVLDIIADYNKSDDDIVYITCAGRSNGLSGMVAANAIHPVIACPPFKDRSDYLVNIHSSTMQPPEVPSMTVVDPVNAALAALRILALADKKLRKQIAEHIAAMKESF